MHFVPILVAIAIHGGGCKNQPTTPTTQPAAATDKDRVQLKLGREMFKLEVAATEDKRELGLMYRKSMPADEGMIFVFRREQELSFWMKNTYLPLDIAYLDAGGKVVSIKQMTPLLETPPVPSDYPAKFAIELNVGAAARCGLKVGDVIPLPERVMNPPELE